MEKHTECWTCGQMLRLPITAAVGMKIRCPSCGSKFLVEDIIQSSSAPPVLHQSEAVLNTVSELGSLYECSICQIDLADRPIIRVGDEICCYRCAKATFARKEDSELARVRSINERLDAQRKSAIDQIDKQIAEAREGQKKASEGDGGCLIFLLVFSALLVFSVTRSGEGTFMPAFLVILGLTIAGWVVYFRSKSKSDADLQSKLSTIPSYPNPPKYEVRNPIRLEIFERCGGLPKGKPPKDYRRLVLERDSFTCQNCGAKKASQNLEVHHVKTQAKGGDDFLTNLVCLCLHCHDRETWFGHVRRNPTTK